VVKTPTRGLLILNLGTPDAAEPAAVGRYLKQFLMDKWVIDIPWLLRWFFVNVLIVPKRKFASAEAYQLIWTKRGSPLAFYLQDLESRVAALIPEIKVSSAMRYGNPSIENGLKRLSDVDEIIIFPLYPQYAESSTRSSREECEKVARQLGLRAKLTFVKDYFEHPKFIDCFAELIAPILETEKPDHLLMSFHGLPERHVKRVGGEHCLGSKSCCDSITPSNRDCYRAQSFATARALALKLGLDSSHYSVSFQSRLGRTPWIPPFTDVKLSAFPSQGIRNIAVVCPSFTTDCLETIEEIGIRGAESFKETGGTQYVAIPCLNARESWAEALVSIAHEHGL
jgi:ferrochelatase